MLGRVAEAAACCRRAERDGTHKLYAPDGSIEAAYDDTSRPLYDTRVWLHMFEGPGGQLLPSFCRRTGAAQYMYDFTGFSEWRVEQNALLGDDAKCLMYKLWAADREVWPEEALAEVFKIRVQRALAIVKIKEREFQHVRPRAPCVLAACVLPPRLRTAVINLHRPATLVQANKKKVPGRMLVAELCEGVWRPLTVQ